MTKCSNRTYKRRRHDRQSRQLITVKSEEIDNANDIEEQLRKQRLKKLNSVQTNASMSQKEEFSDNAPSMQKKTLGRYTYDRSRGTYFPTKFVRNAVEPRSCTRNEFQKERIDLHRPPVVAHVVQLLHGSARRRRFVVQWGGQMIKDSLSVQPNCEFYLDQMRLPQSELTNEVGENSSSSPWSQCFGVVSPHSCSSPPKYFSLRNSSFSHGKPLLCDKGIGCLGTSERRTTFTTFDMTGNRMSYGIFQDEINDFTQVQHSPEWTFFGGNKGQILSIQSSSWFQLEFSTREATIPSDILCVESDRSGAHPDLVFFGQRNGKVLVYDVRTSLHSTKIAGTLSTRKQNDSSVDSVFSMKTMFEHHPDQLLVRGSSSWRVCDLRGLGGCIIGDNSLIRNVSFCSGPDHLSIPGKGMALDPIQSTIIVPFWNKADASDKLSKVSLKFWSLESGDYLGAKALQNEASGKEIATSTGPERRYTFASTDLELCPTVTHAWSFKPIFAEMRKSQETKRLPGAFGLWLKIGAQYINHISCDGRHDFQGNCAKNSELSGFYTS
jgi:hypothetical protein